MIKYNFGCGYHKKDGFINVDKDPKCNPDKIMDLEQIPWDIETNSADVIILEHVLEHLGNTFDDFVKIIQELYRITSPSGEIYIVSPHPYSYNYVIDPTHLRPITQETLEMFSKEMCERVINEDSGSSIFAFLYNVDFSIQNIKYNVNVETLNFLRSKNIISKGEISSEELNNYGKIFMNLIDEIIIKLSVNK